MIKIALNVIINNILRLADIFTFLSIKERRGEFKASEDLGEKRMILTYEVPLSESLRDLHGPVNK